MKLSKSQLLHWPILSLVFLGSMGALFIYVRQEDFYLLLGLYTVAFASYLLLYLTFERSQLKFLWLVAIIAHCLAFLSTPQLSDDYHRFYWDAKIADAGISPYAYTPTEYKNLFPERVSVEEYEVLNSPSYYSVYPPLLQGLYRAAHYFSSGNVTSFVLWMRVLYLVFHFFILALLHSKLESKRKWILYSLNPLLIIEGIGNLHAEVLVAGGIIIILLNSQRKWNVILSSIISIGTKLSPLILYPPIYFNYHKKNNWKLLLIGALLMPLVFYPLLSNWEYGINFFSSLRLYYQTFEFNGSIYIVTREFLSLYYGYNPIAIVGPGLQLIAGLLILGIYRKAYLKNTSEKRIATQLVQIWFIFLLFSTTVHPWYLLPVIGVLAFRLHYSVLFWSYSIILSYAYYAELAEWIQTLFHICQYFLLSAGIWLDMLQKKPISEN